jgi:aspartyl-tRNA(Asn)/glutamyl-tRNA(Gln) amidotransferase subunit A
VPLAGAVPLSRTLDSAGPLARTVDCCTIVDGILSGELLDTEALPLAGLRFGVTADFVGADLDDEVHKSFGEALNKLEAAGALIERFAFPELAELPAINAGGGLIAAEAWAWHRTLLEQQSALYDPRVAARIRRGGQQTAADYIDLLDARQRLIGIAQRRLRSFDAWLMPTVAAVAPQAGLLQQDDAAFFSTNARVLRNPSVINFLNGCALSVPCQPPGARPVGLAICGLGGQDAKMLQIGRSVESLFRQS